jgi:hypothetical protein
MLIAALENPKILTLPLSSWLIIIFFLLACILTFWKDTHKAQMRNELPEGDVPPPDWISYLIYPQYGCLLWLTLIDWNPGRPITTWVTVFVCAVIARNLMLIIGSVLLIPIKLIYNLVNK